MVTTYLGIILGIMLLASTAGASYASAPSNVNVLAKEKGNLIMVLVKNMQGPSIHTIKFFLSDAHVTSIKAPAGWTVNVGGSSLILTTPNNPIKAGDRAVFYVGASDKNTLISWSAADYSGQETNSGVTRAVIKHSLKSPAPDAQLTSIPNARSLTLNTDKIFYNKNDKMFISGILAPNSDLVVTIYTPSGQKIMIKDTTDATGRFQTFHLLQDVESGTYRLKAIQTNNIAETTFKVV